MAEIRHLVTERSADRPHALGYRAFVPEPNRPSLVPLVLVHGSSRGAARFFRAFLPRAIAAGRPLLVPTFSAERFPGYQRLAGCEGPLAARDALLIALEDAQDTLGLDTTKVDVFGFSGGAQFAHRLGLSAPERLRRVVVASAGWYTYLDPDRAFPRGIGTAPGETGFPLDVDGFLRLPLHVLVGERDVQRDANLRTTASLDRRQGLTRLERALRWMDHLEAVAASRGVASRVTFDLLPDAAHSFSAAERVGGVVERTLAYLGAPDQPTIEWEHRP